MVAFAAHSQISISDGGAPNYSKPLSVPPGIAGLAPSISLVYNAGGINGVVGYGWTVQGISTITRCGNTKGIDGNTRSPAFTSDDKLCLDGQRLILTNESGATVAQTSDSLGGTGLVHEYRTEKDTYARIRAYGMANGAAGNGPAYFKVWTKSGQIYEYGNNSNSTANSTIATTGKTVISAWAVSRISDTLGKYIDFQYEQRDVAWGSGTTAGSPVAGHEWNLKEIRYTGTTSPAVAPANKVVFELQDRSNTAGAAQDSAEAYREGAKNVSIRRLNAIRTYVGPVKVKTYKLGYDTGPNTKRSRLKTITECAGAAETACLPPETFNYQSGGSEAYVANAKFNLTTSPAGTPPLLGPTSGVLPGDFNGDGKMDLLVWSDTPANNQLWFSNGDGSFTKSANFNITNQQLSRSDGCYFTVMTDLDGDGLPDLLLFSSVYNKSGFTQCPIGLPVPPLVYLNSGNGSFASKPYTGPTLEIRSSGTAYLTPPNVTEIKHSYGRSFYLMDVDGDGKSDIVDSIMPEFSIKSGVLDPNPCTNQICTWVYKGNGAGGFTSIATNLAHISVYSDTAKNGFGWSSAMIDIDGDGLTDLGGVGNQYYIPGVNAYRSRGDGNFDPTGMVDDCAQSVLDFNGDGRGDCLAAKPPLFNYLYAGTGRAGTNQAVGNFNLTSTGEELAGTGIGVNILDINGDGRQDILRWKDDAAQTVAYLSNGDGTFTPSATFNLNTAARQLKKADGSYDFIAGDFTGRGNVEFLRLKKSPVAGSESTTNQLYVKADPSQPDMLSSYVSSTGLTTTLTWVPLRNSASGSLGQRYASDRDTSNEAKLPNMDITPPMYVVATTVTDSGVGTGKVATEYFYAGLKASHDGRGLQGLRETRRQSYGPNGQPITVVRQYLQGFPHSGVVRQSETWNGALNSPTPQVLSRSTFTYCDTNAPAGNETSATPAAPCSVSSLVKRQYAYKKVDESWDLNGAALPTVTTVKSYTASGEPSSITVTTMAADKSVASIDMTDNLYFADNTAADSWILGRLRKSTQSNSAPSAANASGTVQIMPSAEASLSGIDFGTVSLSGSATATATLTNTGDITLALVVPTASSVSGADFSFVSTTCRARMLPGASCGIVVKVSPTASGTRVGTVKVTTSAGNLSASLTADVSSGASPGTFSVTSGQMNGPASIAIITNTGGQTITGITASCQNSGYGQITVQTYSNGSYGAITTSVAAGAQIAVIAISSTAPTPSPAGYCKVRLQGVNASNSPYLSTTY
jgi:hypothetical protein